LLGVGGDLLKERLRAGGRAGERAEGVDLLLEQRRDGVLRLPARLLLLRPREPPQPPPVEEEVVPPRGLQLHLRRGPLAVAAGAGVLVVVVVEPEGGDAAAPLHVPLLREPRGQPPE